jgi:hypothetical protein
MQAIKQIVARKKMNSDSNVINYSSATALSRPNPKTWLYIGFRGPFWLLFGQAKSNENKYYKQKSQYAIH